MTSGYTLSVATFHKRNQDTNSFRTGQQFLIKLDLKSSGEPFKNPMSLILPRRMVQGHPKTKQSEGSDPLGQGSSMVANEIQDAEAILGNDQSKFYLEVTVHLASSEAIVQACPECCHKVTDMNIELELELELELDMDMEIVMEMEMEMDINIDMVRMHDYIEHDMFCKCHLTFDLPFTRPILLGLTNDMIS